MEYEQRVREMLGREMTKKMENIIYGTNGYPYSTSTSGFHDKIYYEDEKHPKREEKVKALRAKIEALCKEIEELEFDEFKEVSEKDMSQDDFEERKDNAKEEIESLFEMTGVKEE